MRSLLVLLVLVAFTATSIDAIAAEETENTQVSFFDDHDHESYRFVIFEFIRSMCGLDLGRISSKISTEVQFSGNDHKITSQAHLSRKIYDADVIITPEFRLLFSKSYAFDRKETKMKKTDQAVKMEGVDIDMVIEDLGISSQEAADLSKCVEEIGNVLAEGLLGIDNKNLLEAELDEKAAGPVVETISRSYIELEHAKIIISYPTILQVNEFGLIKLTVIPSIRLHSVFKNVDESEDALLARVLRHTAHARRLPLSELQAPFLVESLQPLDIRGNGNYSTEIMESGALVQKPNQYKILAINLRGANLNQVDITPNEQPLIPLTPSRWFWQVQPQIAGTLEFYLSLISENSQGGNKFSKVIPISIPVEWPMTVRVNTFVVKNWTWLAGTIVIPLAIFWWKNRAMRRRSLRAKGA